MARIKLLFSLIFIFSILTFCAFTGYFYVWLNSTILTKNKSVEYYVAQGSSFTKIIQDLYNQEVIAHPKFFYIYFNLVNATKKLKYGTYSFNDKDTPKTILYKFIEGDTISIKVTLPEGLNIYQMAQKLEFYFPKVLAKDWLNFFSNPDFIKQIGIPEDIKNLEGFIFPQTYFLDPHSEPEFVVKSILTEFKKHVTQDLFDKALSMGLKPLEFITLASIVEKETSLQAERPMVSAVYWNRIKRKMKLQADPTVIYGIWDQYTGSLTSKNLITPTPYNTYTFIGLPAGPIANPGIESILATLNPAKTDALYFVASGHGGHIFSNNLTEHNKAVQSYLHYLRTEKKNKTL